MTNLRYDWTSDDDGEHSLELVYVQGTRGGPYPFGEGTNQRRAIEVPDFYIAAVPVTQALWLHVMGPDSNPAVVRGGRRPVENVSWDALHAPDGFLQTINRGPVLAELARQLPGGASERLSLPSETQWEYAARGGVHWPELFPFSGSHDIEAVAWYKDNSGDQMHDVAQKAPNQLGLYDMCGNAWEWCQDSYTSDVANIPADGTPLMGPASERVLRGGCFHNWAIHCTVFKRYQIGGQFHDGCIGFRLVMMMG